MSKVSWGFICVGIVLLSILTGCSSSSSEDLNKTNENINSNELILAVGGEPDNGFDPTTGWGRYGSPLFQSTLLKRDKDLDIINDLAKDYEVSDDGLVWTVKLRDDVKFSDGKPLTSSDVKFTFDTASNGGSVIDLNVLDYVDIVDDTTVSFVLKQPQSTFVNNLVNTGIVPEHAYKPDYALNPVGSGPYMLVQWDKGQQLIVKANPEYYNTQPFFQKITFLFLGEDAAFAAAKAGEVDVAYIPAAFSNQTVAGMKLEAVKTVDNRGIMFPYVKAGNETSDGYPIGNDVTADSAIRHAINIAIDRQLLVDGILEGHGTPAYTSVDDLPWWNPETVFEDGDIEKARKLLNDAGWIDVDQDSVLEKGALDAEFTLLYPASDVIRQSLAIAVADMMQPLGIRIHVEGKSWDDIYKLMYSNAVLYGWGSHDPYEMYNLYHSKNAGIELFNPGFYSNAVVDEYLDKALASTVEEEANEYWKKAQWDGHTGLSTNGDAAWAWLVNIDHLYLVNENLDIGEQRIHPHGHGWPVTDNLVDWKWK